MGIFKAAVLGIGAVVLALQLKQTKPEYGTYLTMAAGLLILGLAVSQLQAVVDAVEKIASFIQVEPQYISILLKIIGISYICEFAANLCRDSGFSAVAGQVEMAGKLSILVMGLPIVTSLLDTIQSFLQ